MSAARRVTSSIVGVVARSSEKTPTKAATSVSYPVGLGNCEFLLDKTVDQRVQPLKQARRPNDPPELLPTHVLVGVDDLTEPQQLDLSIVGVGRVPVLNVFRGTRIRS